MAKKEDLSEFLSLHKPRVRSCGVASALAVLGTADTSSLNAALAEPNEVVSCQAVVLWLKKRGHQVSAQMVRCHRRNECACGR